MTVSELDGFTPGTLPVYASGNFKMTINNERGWKKKYSFSNWVLNDSGSTEWTIDVINEEELKIKSDLIKPNYSSILDFAYYGSGVELIRGTVNDLVDRYPGEIYTREPEMDEIRIVSGGTFQPLTGICENPFEIDVWSSYIKPEHVKNPYRYMCLSAEKYEVAVGNASGTPVTAWTPGTIIKPNPCYVDGDTVFTGATVNNITFNGIYYQGKVYLQTSTRNAHIKLQDKYIDEVFDSLDDFERVLLDRDTKPKFKAKFYTPRETDRGVITYEKAYVWPTLSGGWNLDFESQAYETYLNGLLYIANYYDECRSDNIWRSYTHESIKNFDWTTPRDTYVPEMDGSLIDTERMMGILRVGGRQFDDLKRYIENIKFSVNVSYDSKNNMPDEAMAKFLEYSGWEVKNISPVNDNSLVQIDEYPGKYIKSTPEDANKEFLKRMILNSRNILSKKGTRAGIEEMYSMFGIFDVRHGNKVYGDKIGGITIDEYDAFAQKYVNGGDFTKVFEMNTEKEGYVKKYEETLDDFCGLMVAHKFDIDNVQYLVPWYNRDDVYDGYPYFQMYGGWGKRQRKNVQVDIAKKIGEIKSTDGFNIYDETVKNIRIAESFSELNLIPIGYLHEGDIYYVLNMTDAYLEYGCQESNDSHYVFFYPATSAANLSLNKVSYNDEYVWCLVGNNEFTGATESTLSWYAKKIIYMESLHDDIIGNNPHDGKGIYDGGKEYFEYYNKIFKGAFDENLFDEYRSRIAEENSKRHYENRFRTAKLGDVQDESGSVSGTGFNILIPNCDCSSTTTNNPTLDNEKIWYFLSEDDGLYDAEIAADAEIDFKGRLLSSRENNCWKYSGRTETETECFTSWTRVKKEDFPLSTEQRTCQNKPIADTASTISYPESTLTIPDAVKSYYTAGTTDEIHAFSVINTKNMRITYHFPWEMEDYVTNIVEFYVKQLIPSTVIVEFCWDYLNGPRPESRSPYASIRLTPEYQSIRSNETEAEIDIERINVNGVRIAEEETINN